jgi:outer membrane protein OmpA-like peptidoglycan-associated protein
LDLRHGIYCVCIPEELRPEKYLILKGKVTCREANELSPVIDKLNFNVKFNSDFHKDFTYSTVSESGSYLFICPNNAVADISLEVADFPEQKFVVWTDTITSVRIFEKDFEFQKAKDSTLSKVENLNYTLYFDFDDYHLNTQQISELKQFLNTLNNGNKIQFVITGHTDSVGTETYNRNLSLKRANEVGKQLQKLGINIRRISIIAKAYAEPLGIDDSKNRRVEIKAIIEE